MLDLSKFPKGNHGKFGKGFIPDAHDRSKDLSVRALLGGTRFQLAANASLEQYMSGIYDQGQTSSCVGWALAQAIQVRCGAAGTPISLPSPLGIYVCARAEELHLAGQTATSSSLTDDGCQPILATQGITEWGVASNDAWPFDPAKIDDPPNLAELECASAFKVTGYYRCSDTGAQRVLDVKQAISTGYPVFIGTAVDQKFEDYEGGTAGTGVPNAVSAPDPQNILGGHGMFLVGYQMFGNVTLYRGVNQWGNTWGDRGLYWADESFITSDYLTDMVVMTGNATGHVGSVHPKVKAAADAAAQEKK